MKQTVSPRQIGNYEILENKNSEDKSSKTTFIRKKFNSGLDNIAVQEILHAANTSGRKILFCTLSLIYCKSSDDIGMHIKKYVEKSQSIAGKPLEYIDFSTFTYKIGYDGVNTQGSNICVVEISTTVNSDPRTLALLKTCFDSRERKGTTTFCIVPFIFESLVFGPEQSVGTIEKVEEVEKDLHFLKEGDNTKTLFVVTEKRLFLFGGLLVTAVPLAIIINAFNAPSYLNMLLIVLYLYIVGRRIMKILHQEKNAS